MDYAAIKVAYQAIPAAQQTPLSVAFAALEAQTTTKAVDVPVQAVAAYLGANMKLASFLAWAAAPPAGASVAAIDGAQELAFAFAHPQLVPSFAMSNPTIAAQMQEALAALVAPGAGITGPITAVDQAAILALAQQSVPMWPNLTIRDLWLALGQPTGAL